MCTGVPESGWHPHEIEEGRTILRSQRGQWGMLGGAIMGVDEETSEEVHQLMQQPPAEEQQS
ncbi:MAG: hypothetical protein PHO20_00005 [Candidatus Peribacteraceae bacterium]|nr:hypothetical protein [Candidatus Peribacteraceae bacterium]